MPPELALMLAPRPAYAALARRPIRLSPLVALRRPLLVALVFGAALSLSATGRVTPGLVLASTLMWSYWVVAQIVVAVALIRNEARRTVGLPRALDLFFAGHAPWSLAYLLAAAWAPSAVGRPLWPLAAVVAVALVLTLRIVAAFFREVLEIDPRQARRRALAHQAISWLLLLAWIWMTSALTPRVLKLMTGT